MYWLVGIVLFTVAYAEATFLRVPLVLVVLLLLLLMYKETWVFVAALLAGIVYDILLVYPLGVSSIYFLTFLFLVFLYEKKYEITSLAFVGIATAIGAYGFSLLHAYTHTLSITVTTSSIAMSVYWIITAYMRRKAKQVW